MALRVWLPLNGTLENKGISELISANVQSGVAIDNNGKIGKCYTNSGTTANVATPISISSPQFSMAAWVKINTRRNNWCRGFGVSGNSTYAGLACEHTNGTSIGFHFYKTINGTNTSIFDTYPTTQNTGVWVHWTMCYDGTKFYIYQNGTLLTSSNVKVPNTSFDMTSLWLFGGTSGNYSSQCSLNDVRIYDHCLSQKEVKEISQGLVLHYKLDGLSQGSGNNLVTGLTKGGQTTVVGDTIVTSGQNSDTYFKIVLSSALELNKSYTMGIDAENLPDGGYFRFPIGSQSNSSAGYIDIYNGHNESVFIANDVIVNCGTSLMMDDNVRTAWPNQCIFKNFYIYENTSIADSSGYEHDGNIVNVTTENINSDGRYQVCTNFLGTTVDTTSNTIIGAQYLYASFPMPAWSALTLAWWGNNIAYGRGGIFETTGTTGNIWEGNDYNTTAVANWDSTFGIYNGSSRVNIFSNFVKDGSWHYHVITFDGANVKYYCDGTLKQTSALTGTLPAITGFKIGLGRAGGVYRQIKQKMSDLRIYTTSLSAEDILDLYHTSANVDNLGNLHGFEFVEDNTDKFSILKNGIISITPIEGGTIPRILNNSKNTTPNMWNASNNNASVLNSGTIVNNYSDEYGYDLTIGSGKTTGGARISYLGFNGGTGPYTFSAYIKADKNINIATDFCDVNATPHFGNSITTEWKYYAFTVNKVSNYNTPGNYNGFFDVSFSGAEGDTVYIRSVKVEQNDVPTQWVPHIDDTNFNFNNFSKNGIGFFQNFIEK